MISAEPVIHAIVLAGGMATRLYPLTQSIPKCLVPCAGRPFIDYQLMFMANKGVQRVTFVLGYLGEMAVEHLQKLKVPGLHIDWILEGSQRLGTGGAVDLALRSGSIGEAFLVVYGDSFMPIDYGQVWQTAVNLQSKAMMTVLHNKGQFERSNCSFKSPWVPHYSKDPVVQARERFEYVDYGVTYWQTEAFKMASPELPVWDLADAMRSLSLAGKMHGLEVGERFYEIGSPSGLSEFRQVLDGEIDHELGSMLKSLITEKLESQ